MPEILVVGGGMGGLQLAALFAADGRDVLLLEQQAQVGGRAVARHKNGFILDNGLHGLRFGTKSATARVFAHLGKPLMVTPIGKSFVEIENGRVVELPTSPAGCFTTELFGPRERLQLLALLASIKGLALGRRGLAALAERLPVAAAAATKAVALAGRLPGFRRLPSVAPEPLFDTTVADWLDQLHALGHVRDYFLLVCASMQVCPFLDQASAGELLANLSSVLARGISFTYPSRGWYALIDDLVAAITQHGEIRTGVTVERVRLDHGRATGVVLQGGEEVSADTVILALPAPQVFGLVDAAAVPAPYVATCRSLTPTAGLVLDYGLKSRVSEATGLWYLKAPLSFGWFTSNLCPALAPPGKQLLTWLVPTAPAIVADKPRGTAVIAEVERALFRIFPGLEAAIEWRREMRLETVDGVEVNVRQHRGRRPACRVPGITGLFLVGDTVAAPGAGGDIGHESVLETYREITGHAV
jgi:phytoene dehydrogenase-like protein